MGGDPDTTAVAPRPLGRLLRQGESEWQGQIRRFLGHAFFLKAAGEHRPLSQEPGFALLRIAGPSLHSGCSWVPSHESTGSSSKTLARPANFWFLHCRMTRSRISGPEIMAWRKAMGRPRRWLAERLGVSPKTIESWEYETRNPSGPALRLLELLMRESSPIEAGQQNAEKQTKRNPE